MTIREAAEDIYGPYDHIFFCDGCKMLVPTCRDCLVKKEKEITRIIDIVQSVVIE